ncbi:MAG: PqqD family protein [Acidobacteriota bacterium]
MPKTNTPSADMAQAIDIPTNVYATYTDGTAVLMETRTGRYIGLDEVGTRIWQLLTELRDPAKVVTAMDAEYDAPRERLEQDLAAFIRQCRDRGLLAPAGPSAGVG